MSCNTDLRRYQVIQFKPGDKTGDGVNNVWHVVKQ